MLILGAEIWRGPPRADVRILGGRIAAVGQLAPQAGEPVIEAHGGLLLPGLWDHHVHLAASAVAFDSAVCGPPAVTDEAGLAAALDRPGEGWLRGVGYHESVAGMLRRDQLDRIGPDRPVRIQHRSGRMWFFNSLGIDLLRQAGGELPASFDLASGQLFDADAWLRTALGAQPPVLARLGAEMARLGVVGVTEMSPANARDEALWLADERAKGHLPQKVLLAGSLALGQAAMPAGIALGPFKLHLIESALPDLDATIAAVRSARVSRRAVAVHCTTRTELVFALAVLEAAGPSPGDRIEHAGIADDELVGQTAALGLQVVSQPHFIAERGDHYRALVPEEEWPQLYRLSAFTTAGVTLAAGSDAPFGSLDPWAAMRAATARRTASGHMIGADEALSAEAALDLFLRDPHDLTRQRRLAVGEPPDLCLLSCGWERARVALAADDVRATLIGGALVYQRIDQAPGERALRPDPAA